LGQPSGVSTRSSACSTTSGEGPPSVSAWNSDDQPASGDSAPGSASDEDGEGLPEEDEEQAQEDDGEEEPSKGEEVEVEFEVESEANGEDPASSEQGKEDEEEEDQEAANVAAEPTTCTEGTACTEASQAESEDPISLGHGGCEEKDDLPLFPQPARCDEAEAEAEAGSSSAVVPERTGEELGKELSSSAGEPQPSADDAESRPLEPSGSVEEEPGSDGQEQRQPASKEASSSSSSSSKKCANGWSSCSLPSGRLWSEDSEVQEKDAAAKSSSQWTRCSLPSGRLWSDDCELPDPPPLAGPPGVWNVGKPVQAPAVQEWTRAISAESTSSFASHPAPAMQDWTRAISGESCQSFGAYPWSRALSGESVQSFASRVSRCSGGDPDDKDMTLRSIMQALETVEPNRVLQVRRIKQLGFGSTVALREHCSKLGAVDRVLVSHSRAQARLRPASLGFIIMAEPSGVQAVLAAGTEQRVGGVTVKLGAFERQAAAAAGGGEEEA